MKRAIGLFLISIGFVTGAQAQIHQNVGADISLNDSSRTHVLGVYPNGFPNVDVVFNAYDEFGGQRWSIEKSDLTVSENGQLCEVLDLVRLTRREPIKIALVIDHSGSMHYDEDNATYHYYIDHLGRKILKPNLPEYNSSLDYAVKAMKKFIRSFDDSKDSIAVVGFSSYVDRVPHLTNHRYRSIRYLESLKPNGKTAFYDAIIAAQKRMRKHKGRRVIIALTDGKDSASEIGFRKFRRKLRKSDLEYFFVGLGEVSKDTLTDLADNCRRGHCYYTRSSTSLVEIYEEISRKIQAVYQLTYRSPNFASLDSSRTINIRFANDSNDVSASYGYTIPGNVIHYLAQKERKEEYDMLVEKPGLSQPVESGNETYYLLFGILAAVGTGTTLVLRGKWKHAKVPTESSAVGSRDEIELVLFPNPTTGPFAVKYSFPETHLNKKMAIYTVNGELISEQTLVENAEELQFDFSDKRSATYLVVVRSELGSVSERLVVLR